MKFRLGRLKISEALKDLAAKKIKKQKIEITRATKKKLVQLAKVVGLIESQGLPDYLVLKELGNNLGSGIFLHPKAEPILKGDVIVPYSGIVALSPRDECEESDYMFCILHDLVLNKEEQAEFDPKNRFHPRRLYSLDVDAQKKGNFARFINHCSKPNVEADVLRIPPNSLGLTSAPCEVIYLAKKKILPGEQLLVCYEGDDKSYWGAMKVTPLPMTPRTFRLNKDLQLISS